MSKFKFVRVWSLMSAKLALLSFILYLELLINAMDKNQSINEVEKELSTIVAGLESMLKVNFELLRGAAAYIEVNPKLTQVELSSYLSELIKNSDEIISVDVAKGLPISHLYPHEKGKSVLAVTYQELPEQFEFVQVVDQSKRLVVSDPEILALKGGEIIGQLPIKVNDKSWGSVSIVLDYEKLIAKIAPKGPKNIDFTIKNTNQSGDTFLGDAEILDSALVKQVVDLQYGHWTLYAQPKGGWQGFKLHWQIWGLAFIFLALVFNVFNVFNVFLLEIPRENFGLKRWKALREFGKRLLNFLFKHEVIMLIVNEDGIVVEANSAAIQLYGYPPFKLLNRKLEQVVTNNSNSMSSDQRLFPSSKRQGVLLRFSGGQVGCVGSYKNKLELNEKELNYTITCGKSERKEFEKKRKLNEHIYDYSHNGIMVIDRFGTVISVNPAFESMVGFYNEQMTGVKANYLISTKHSTSFFRYIYYTVHKYGWWQGEMWSNRKNGQDYLDLVSISAVKDSFGKVRNYIVIFSELSEQKLSEERLNRLVYYDSLTGLPNRVSLQEHVKKTVAVCKRNESRFAVLFLELDRFKLVNNCLGYALGDELLKQVTERLSLIVEGADFLARIGENEFVLLVSQYETSHALSLIANELENTLAKPFYLERDYEANIGASIGIARFPIDSVDPEELLRFASASVYKSKHKLKDKYTFYSEAISQEASSKLNINAEIIKAIQNDEFELFLQPQVDLSLNKIIGAEALIRWNHPKTGLRMPSDFIRLAEQCGAMTLITEWILNKLTKVAEKWHSAGRYIKLSFNISALDLCDDSLIRALKLASKNARFEPSLIYIEITESALIKNVESAILILEKIKRMGYRVSIDDFGTGYSSFFYISRLPADELKIDRSFVQNMQDDSHKYIVKSMIDLAKNFNLNVIAEGIESVAEVTELIGMNCIYGQGYLYSKPIPEEEFYKKFQDVAVLGN